MGSIPTLVRVFLCPCVGPLPSVGLTLTWFIWGTKLALHITLESVKKHTQSGFSGTIEAVGNITNTESEEFSQVVASVSGDYELREDFQTFVVLDFLSRSDEGRSRYIRNLTLSTMEDLYAADGPETFGWIAISGYNTKSQPSSGVEIDCHTKSIPSLSVDSFHLLDKDPRLEAISSSTLEAMVKKSPSAFSQERCLARTTDTRWKSTIFSFKPLPRKT